MIEADNLFDSNSSTEMYDQLMGNGASSAMCALVLPSTVTDIMMGSKGYYEMLYLTAISDDELDAAGKCRIEYSLSAPWKLWQRGIYLGEYGYIY